MTVGADDAVFGVDHDIVKEGIDRLLQLRQTGEDTCVVMSNSQRGDVLLRAGRSFVVQRDTPLTSSLAAILARVGSAVSRPHESFKTSAGASVPGGRSRTGSSADL